jgi:hypothetical protein
MQRLIVGDVRERGLDHEPVPSIYHYGLIMQPGLYFLARPHGDDTSISLERDFVDLFLKTPFLSSYHRSVLIQ